MSFRFVILLSLWLSGCTESAPSNGVYKGTVDGQSQQTVTVKFNTTGDGLTMGAWNSSNPDFKTGQVVSKESLVLHMRSYVLLASDGGCNGEYEMEMKISSDKVTGTIEGGKLCPGKRIAFTLNHE